MSFYHSSYILEQELARHKELLRISEVAIGLHEDRIAGHRALAAHEQAEIKRIERCLAGYLARGGRRRHSPPPCHFLQAAE